MKKLSQKIFDKTDNIIFKDYFLKKKNFLNYSNEIRINYKKKKFHKFDR